MAMLKLHGIWGSEYRGEAAISRKVESKERYSSEQTSGHSNPIVSSMPGSGSNCLLMQGSTLYMEQPHMVTLAIHHTLVCFVSLLNKAHVRTSGMCSASILSFGNHFNRIK